MYAVIRRYETDPQRVEELKQRVQEGVVPIVAQVSGFVAHYDVDAGGGVLASVSVFSDQAGVEESDRRVGDWAMQNLSAYLKQQPTITAGTVFGHQSA